ncbi:MAG: hypothetical protein VB957_17010 [Pseudomonadales bacterium]
MFKLIAFALHFSPYSQSPFDPTVIEMLRRELSTGKQRNDNVVDLQISKELEESRKAA